MKTKRPVPGKLNTLLVVCEHFSGLADPWLYPSCLQMPNLCRLAESGTGFRNASCSAPVCGPSRMSMLSGLSPCHHGAYDNGSTLRSNIPTYAHLLSAAGVETAICGRMHIHGLDHYKGFARRLATEILNPMVEQKPDWPAAGGPIPALPEGPIAPPEPSDSAFYHHDQCVTDRAVEFLEVRDERSAPFHLTVGYLAAHPGGHPNPAYQKWYDHYLNHPELPISPFRESDYELLPENARRLLWLGKRTRDIFTERHARQALAIHFAGLSFLDEQLGVLLNTLDRTGLRDSTVVCFTADHGENMGRHGLWGKMNFYEEALRVPLYFSGPGIVPGQVVEAPVSLNDLLPTLAELVTVKPDIPMDGISLMPALCNRGELPADRSIFSEYHGYLCQCGGYMLRKNGWKLVHYPAQEDELYDLERDPAELRNLASSASHAPIYRSLLAELDSFFHVADLEGKISDYNRQRSAVMKGITSSAIACERMLNEIEVFRNQWNEPWWDNGEYMKRYESHLRRHQA